MATIKIHSKQPHLQLSIFAVMSQLAREHNAINLSQGYPDFDVHPDLINSVHHRMKQGMNQYAPMPGVPELREAISKKTAELYGKCYNPDQEITITAGATEALFAAITALIHPGDEVIVFEPWYDAYVPNIQYNQGVPKYVEMLYPDFHIDWKKVRALISSKTRAIILNSPHNPTGAVLKESDLRELESVVKDTNILIISDEVYEHIIFDETKHLSLASFPNLAERSLVISSFGKTYHTTGWKVGYCLAPGNLTEEFRKVHQFINYSVNTPIQLAYADFMRDADHYKQLAAFYQEKRDLFRNLMSESRFRMLPCSGTYFQLADYSEISDAEDTQFARRLTTEHKVACIPTAVFYTNPVRQNIVRFCFAKREDTLKEAAERLCSI